MDRVTKLVRLPALSGLKPVHGSDVREKQRVPAASLRYERAIGFRLDLEEEDIRSFLSVEDKGEFEP